MSLNLKECQNACTNCVSRYIEKHRLRKGDKFAVKCNGIPIKYVPDEILATLDEDPNMSIASVDPVTWAATFLDWHCLDPDGEVWKRKTADGTIPPNSAKYDEERAKAGKSIYHRPYQAEMLRCLHGDTEVFLGNGTLKKIKEIEPGDIVVTYNEGRKKTQRSYKVLNKWNNGERDVFKVSLENGDSLIVTDNHPILSWFHEGKKNNLVGKKSFKRVYKSLKEGLSIGDKIYTLNEFGVFGEIDNVSLAKLMGYLVTDGCVKNSGIVGKKHVVQFRNTRRKYVEEFQKLVLELFNINAEIKYHPKYKNKSCSHKESWSVSYFKESRELLSFLAEIGCTGPENREISILNYAFKFNKKALGVFINRAWAGDGCVYNSPSNDSFRISNLSLASGNTDFLNKFRYLLKKIGIYASHIYKDKKEGKGYRLSIRRSSDVERFFLEVGLIFGKETQSEIAKKEISKRASFRRHGKCNTLSRTKITNIEYLGKDNVWDIEVDTRHNFVANGLIVHNCSSRRKVFRVGRQAGKTEVLCISILYAIWTHKQFKVVVITPYQSQIEMIFGRIDDLIKSNDILFMSRSRYVKSPSYKMELFNGSNIIGFTAGTRSGQEAGAARGQPANMLVFDEADYLCVSPDTLIEGSDGTISFISDDIPKDYNIHCLDESLHSNIAPAIWKSRREETNLYAIKSSYGYLETTKDHKHIVLTDNGVTEKAAEDLQIGDFFIHPRQGILGHRSVDPRLCQIMGYFLGDGYLDRTTIEFTDKDISNLVFYRDLAVQLGFTNKGKISKYSSGKGYRLRLSSKTFVDYIEKWFPGFLTSKKITKEISTLDIEGLGAFLSGFYDAEGSVNLTRNSVVVSQEDFTVIRIIRLLLQKLGILSSLSKHKPSGFGKNPVYQLSIAEDRFIKLFNNYIGFGSSAKSAKLEIAITNRVSNPNKYSNLRYHAGYFKDIFQSIKKSISKKFTGKQIIFDSLHRKVNPTLNSIEKLLIGLEQIGEEDFINQIQQRICCYASRINIIHPMKNRFKEVYDLRVPKTNNFVASGTLTHNSPGDINAAIATIANFPEATVWMSSTPTGARAKFYETCMNKQYREFFYPSFVNPNWTQDLDDYFKSELTEAGYKHEIKAEFGEQEEGVYQNKYIEQCQAEFNYGDLKPTKEWAYTIGVDWNDHKIGTTIAVMGFNPDDGLFYLVEKDVVRRGEWTQLAACQRISQLNRKWLPEFIYVDQGFGTTQIEVLRKFGFDQTLLHGPSSPDSRLKDIVKGYSFSTSIEITDPFTKQKVKKHSKSFLVENSVRRFEQIQIRYPRGDLDFTAQLQNYVVDRVSMYGQPVYGVLDEKVGDHFLDAVNLALVAHTLEKSMFSKPKFVANISMAGTFGDSHLNKKEEGEHRPGNRTSEFSKDKSIFEQLSVDSRIPAANTDRKPSSNGVWSWPGFGYDAPKPTGNMQGKIKLGRTSKMPKRTKF